MTWVCTNFHYITRREDADPKVKRIFCPCGATATEVNYGQLMPWQSAGCCGGAYDDCYLDRCPCNLWYTRDNNLSDQVRNDHDIHS